MAGHRHATDRTDWTLVAECPNNGKDHVSPLLDDDPDKEHLSIEACATNAAKRREKPSSSKARTVRSVERNWTSSSKSNRPRCYND
jgi:hypothetical protein